MLTKEYSKYCSMSGKASVFNLMKNHTQQRYEIIHQKQRKDLLHLFAFLKYPIGSKIVELCKKIVDRGFQLFLYFMMIAKTTT